MYLIKSTSESFNFHNQHENRPNSLASNKLISNIHTTRSQFFFFFFNFYFFLIFSLLPSFRRSIILALQSVEWKKINFKLIIASSDDENREKLRTLPLRTVFVWDETLLKKYLWIKFTFFIRKSVQKEVKWWRKKAFSFLKLS